MSAKAMGTHKVLFISALWAFPAFVGTKHPAMKTKRSAQ